MQQSKNKLLGIKHLAGLTKLGDLMITKNNTFPGFSETACIEKIETVLRSMHPSDIESLKILLWTLNYLPKFMIKVLLLALSKTHRIPQSIAGPFRQLSLALRGLVYTLYYSNHTSTHYQGQKVYDVIDYHVNCTPLDNKK